MNDAYKQVNDKSLGDINAANRDMWDAGKPNYVADKTPESHAKSAKYYGEQVTSALKKHSHVEPEGARSLATKAAHHGKKALGQDGELSKPSKEIGKLAGKRAEKIGPRDEEENEYQKAYRKKMGHPTAFKEPPKVPKPSTGEFAERGTRGFSHYGPDPARGSAHRAGPERGAFHRRHDSVNGKDESDPGLSDPSTEVGAKDAKKIHGPLSAMQTIAAKNEELHSLLRPGRKPSESTIRQKVMSRPRSETPGWMGKSEKEASAHLRRQKDVAPPGFEGTVKAMKKSKKISNPYALAWSMKNKGYKSHA